MQLIKGMQLAQRSEQERCIQEANNTTVSSDVIVICDCYRLAQQLFKV